MAIAVKALPALLTISVRDVTFAPCCGSEGSMSAELMALLLLPCGADAISVLLIDITPHVMGKLIA